MSEKHIFVVDDDPDVLDTICDVIAEICHVSKFTDPRTITERLDQGDIPDVLVTDITMPGLSGLELVKRVGEYNLNIPIIIISGNATKDNAIEALHLGAFDLLEKPYNVKRLRHVVKKALAFSMMSKLNDELFQSLNLMHSSTRELLENYIKKYLDAEKRLFDLGELKPEDQKQVAWQAKTEEHLQRLDELYELLLEKKVKYLKESA